MKCGHLMAVCHLFHFPPYLKVLKYGKIVGFIEIMSFNIFHFPPYIQLINNGKIIGILYLSLFLIKFYGIMVI